MTETPTIYAFLEMFRSEVGFPRRMATEAYGSSHPLGESRGQLEPIEEEWTWLSVLGLVSPSWPASCTEVLSGKDQAETGPRSNPAGRSQDSQTPCSAVHFTSCILGFAGF